MSSQRHKREFDFFQTSNANDSPKNPVDAADETAEDHGEVASWPTAAREVPPS